jgi:hypothetical protein
MKAPASIFKYDRERASQADRHIKALCESRGLDEHWYLAHRLIAACEAGFEIEDALKLLVNRLKPRDRELLADLLIERLERRG